LQLYGHTVNEKGKINQIMLDRFSIFVWSKFQIYICVRFDIFLPISSIVKTLVIAFFNGTFSALDLSFSTKSLYSFAYSKQVLLTAFVKVFLFVSKRFFYFLSSFFSLIDPFRLAPIVFAIVKFVKVPR
jgi:hypothetical protein